MAVDVAFGGNTNIMGLMADDSGPVGRDGITRERSRVALAPSSEAQLGLLAAEGGGADGGAAGSGRGATLTVLGGGGVAGDPTTSPGQRRLANICFLLLGIGVAMAWTAFRAGIAYFAQRFPSVGSSFYTYMMVAYNVPVLPLLVAQMLYDHKYDSLYGSARAYTFRLALSMSIMAIALLAVPFASIGVVMALVVLIGVMDSVAYGTASQFFSIFPTSVGGYYFIGASLTSLISIGLTFATRFDGTPPTESAAIAMYTVSALVVLAGLGGVLYLLRSPIGRAYLAQKDAQAAAKAAEKLTGAGRDGDRDGLLAAGAIGIDDSGEGGTKVAAGASDGDGEALSNMQLLRITGYIQASIFFCWFATNWVDSLIAFVPSQSDTPASVNPNFRLITLYASLLGELAGKQLNICRGDRLIRRPRSLLIAVAVRWVLMLPFLLYVTQPLYTSDGTYRVRSDGVFITYQVVFDMSGSLFSSLCYGIAPTLLASPLQRSQNSTLLAIVLMLGVYAGLGGSLALTAALDKITPAAYQ